MERHAHLTPVRYLVVKIGTRMVLRGEEPVDYDFLDGLARQIARLREREIRTLLVVSGSVALGRRALRLPAHTEQVSLRQAAAAVGQPELMRLYREALAAHGLVAAQILLTTDDMTDRSRSLHIRNTVETLLKQWVVPVINENDTVSVEGVTSFGENDRLAAIVAAQSGAGALLFLSDESGLCTADPKRHPEAEIIPLVRPGEDPAALCGDAGGDESRGGMKKKLEAAQLAVVCGIPVVMTDGRQENVILRVLAGEALGTFFLPGERLDRRKIWIFIAREPRGGVLVNEGARQALTRADGASLLPVGVVAAEGDFRVGDTVEVLGPGREVLARGITNFSAPDVRRIKGLPSHDVPRLLGRPAPPEVIHRDNMVVIAG